MRSTSKSCSEVPSLSIYKCNLAQDHCSDGWVTDLAAMVFIENSIQMLLVYCVILLF